jgi:hypothetical protein
MATTFCGRRRAAGGHADLDSCSIHGRQRIALSVAASGGRAK